MPGRSRGSCARPTGAGTLPREGGHRNENEELSHHHQDGHHRHDGSRHEGNAEGHTHRISAGGTGEQEQREA